MAFVQHIAYRSPYGYFAGYLQNILDSDPIKGSVTFENGVVTLVLDDSDLEALEAAAAKIGMNLPYSIFIGSVESAREARDISPTPFKPEAAAISLCPQCLQQLFEPASSDYLNQALVCNHYGADVRSPAISPVDMKQAVKKLVDGDSVTVGQRSYRNSYTPGDTLFVADASRLHELLLLSSQEANTLLSIEKPLLKTAIRSDAIKEATGRSVIKTKLFDDAQSAILAKELQVAGIPYLFMTPHDDLEVAVNKDQLMILKAPRLAAPMQPQHDDPVINRYLHMIEEFGITDVSSVGAYLPSDGALRFILRSAKVSKPVITFAPFNPSGFLDAIAASSDAKGRLTANFKEAFPRIAARLAALQEQEGAELFDIVAAVLELPDGYESVHDASLGFLGNGGVKVDVNYKEGTFDYASLIASLMSFKLAGIETPLLAHSLFESLGDLVTDTLTQLKERFKTGEFILYGSLLGNTALFSRIQKNFGHANPRISSRYPLDD